MHVINATEYLEFLSNYKEEGQNYLDVYFNAIKLHHKMQQSKIKCSSANCVKYNSMMQMRQSFVGKTMPQVLTLSFNWNIMREEDARSLDILSFCLSLTDKLPIQGMFELEADCTNKNAEYNLKAMVCFVGKHYLVFIRFPNLTPDKYRYQSKWTLFNDTQVRDFKNGWSEVVDYCVDTKAVPTLLVFD